MAVAVTRQTRPISAETRRRLSEAQLRRFARDGVSAEVRAAIAERNRRRGRRRRAEVAAKLQTLGDLTDTEAGRLVGRDRATVRSIRDEYGLPGLRSRPMSEWPRDARGRLLPHPPPSEAGA